MRSKFLTMASALSYRVSTSVCVLACLFLYIFPRVYELMRIRTVVRYFTAASDYNDDAHDDDEGPQNQESVQFAIDG